MTFLRKEGNKIICSNCSNDRPPCSIIPIPVYNNFPKYNKLKNFLLNKSNKQSKWLSCHKDIGALIVNENNEVEIDEEKCIGCFSCLVNCPYYTININDNKKMHLLEPRTFSYQTSFRTIKEITKYFKGERIELPKYPSFIKKIKSLEEFTNTNEVEHLSLWGLNILKFLSASPPRVGKEIEIAKMDNPRDGRLDICILCNDILLVLESKTNFDDLMKENRYRIQIPSYVEEGNNVINEFNKENEKNIKLYVILLIGGRESDLFPPKHPDCTSDIGNQGDLFYNQLVKSKIKFISANALFALISKSISSNKKICWDILLPKIFDDKNSIGLLTAGIVTLKHHKYYVESIPENYLSEAERFFV